MKKDLLIKLYQQIGRTADDLPYTPHFESLHGPYIAAQSEPKPSRAEVWRHLLAAVAEEMGVLGQYLQRHRVERRQVASPGR